MTTDDVADPSRRRGRRAPWKVVVPAVLVVVAVVVGVVQWGGDQPSAPVGEVEEPTVEAEPVASDGCENELAEPGVYHGTSEVAAAQDYILVVPNGYVDTAPVPLAFFLSAGGSAPLDTNYEWWEPYLEDVESLFVIADSTNALGFDTEAHVGLIDEIGIDHCVDLRHVHAVGISSSAGKAMQLACDEPDRIASVSASIGLFRSFNCETAGPIPLLAFTGDPDLDTTTTSAAWLAEHNGCAPEPVDDDLGSGVTRSTYQDCGASVVTYHVAGGDHGVFFRTCLGSTQVPGGGDFCQENAVVDQLQEMEAFFDDHPLTSQE